MHMNKRTIIQVPLSAELRAAAEKKVADSGFSSLQETIRVLLTRFAKGELKIGVYEEPAEYVKLSPAKKRWYAKAVREIKAGIGVTKTKNIDELIELLHS